MINKLIWGDFMEFKKKRLNVDLPEDMINELDYFAKKIGLNRTSMIAVIVKNYIDQQKSFSMLSDDGAINKIMKKLDK
mgnify:FL=1